jgi:thioredoxin 1
VADDTVTLNDANWEKEVKSSQKPCLVKFWAEWCVPSKDEGVVLAAATSKYRDRFRFGSLNVEENPKVTELYAIQGLPTLLLFKGGEVALRRVGLVSRVGLPKLLEQCC